MTPPINEKSGRRAAPAFQMYAPDRLADRNFKVMSLTERGLLHTMELECWTNGSLPGDLRELARVLGLETGEVEEALTARVMRYLERREVPEHVIISPQLEAYRQKLEERHAKMAEGGQKTAEIHRQRKLATSHPVSHPLSPLSREERKGEEQSVCREENTLDPFVRALDGPAPFEVDAQRSAIR